MIGPLANVQLDSKMDTQTVRGALNPLIASDVMFCNDDVEGYLHPASMWAIRGSLQTAKATNSSYRLPLIPPITTYDTNYNVPQAVRARYTRVITRPRA